MVQSEMALYAFVQVEVEGMREAHLRDAVALCGLLHFLEKEVTLTSALVHALSPLGSWEVSLAGIHCNQLLFSQLSGVVNC